MAKDRRPRKTKPQKSGDVGAPLLVVGRNTAAGRELQGFIDEIERVDGERKTLGEHRSAIFARAKPHDLQEAEQQLDMYLHALGMATDTPLFRAVGLMAVDLAAREQVIEALKQFVPRNGEITVTIGPVPVRLWRDATGEVRADDVTTPTARPAPVVTAERGRGKASAQAKAVLPDVDVKGAERLGREAFTENRSIIDNPFLWGDARREAWDGGWRGEGAPPETPAP